MTGKYTLVIDGNFFLHKTFFVGHRIKQGKPFNFIDEPEADKNLLLWKLSTDFASEMRRFEGVINRVVYTVDSSSWRKKLLDSDYKGTRTKSADINWSGIYDVHTEFYQGLEKAGVTISRIYGAEADDLIFAWSSFLNQQGQNAIIISGDNDLLQLVNKDKSSNSNTLYYNKFDKNLHVFPGFDSWVSTEELKTTNDIFNLPVDLMSNVKSGLNDIIKANKMQTSEVNTNEFIFKKILIGDAGDNVPPLYVKVKETKAGPRAFRVTDKHANTILDKFKDERIHVNQSHLFNEELITRICELAIEVIKIDDKTLDEVIQRWKTNRDLMFLHKDCIPDEVNKAMFDSIEEKWKITITGPALLGITNKDVILEKTSYTKESASSFNEPGIFRSASGNASPNPEVKVIKDEEKTSSGFDSSKWDSLI